MAEGKNQIELKFVNNLSETQKIHFAMQMASDKLALKSVVPLETVVYNTEDPLETPSNPLKTRNRCKERSTGANIKIPMPVSWIWKTRQRLSGCLKRRYQINDAVLEMEFVVDSEFRSGHMFFVAPDDALCSE